LRGCSSFFFFPQDNRSRSTSAPLNGSEQKVEGLSDERWSAPELMLSPPPTPGHYDYPRKFSEPPVPVELKVLQIYICFFAMFLNFHMTKTHFNSTDFS